MFGDESEAAIVKVMRLREQLRPYVMEQYKAAAADGTPIMRPLFFDFHTDLESQTVDDQLMFGPDYLVAPVLQKGVQSRSVYLPPLPKVRTADPPPPTSACCLHSKVGSFASQNGCHVCHQRTCVRRGLYGRTISLRSSRTRQRAARTSQRPRRTPATGSLPSHSVSVRAIGTA